jgi:hypothetical protein
MYDRLTSNIQSRHTNTIRSLIVKQYHRQWHTFLAFAFVGYFKKQLRIADYIAMNDRMSNAELERIKMEEVTA